MDELRLAPGALAELLALVEAGTISGKIGKQLLPALFQARARACSEQSSLPDAQKLPRVCAVAGARRQLRTPCSLAA